jgi:hypothetical protein
LFDQSSKIDARTTTSTKNIFESSVAKPLPTFSFSGNQSSNTATIFGGQAQVPSTTAFNFGGSVQKPEISGSEGSGDIRKSFAFGGNTVESSKSPAFGTKTGVPTFGSSSISDTAKSFDITSNNQTHTTNLFNNKANNETPKIFSFGSNSVTPTFGNNSGTPTFGNNTGAPTFGNNSGTPTFGNNSATPTFGNNSATPTFGNNSGTPTFGSTSNNTTFGGSTFMPPFGSNGGASSATSTGGNSAASPFSTSTGNGDVNKTFDFMGNDPAPSPILPFPSFNIGSTNASAPSAPRGRPIRTATRRTNR